MARLFGVSVLTVGIVLCSSVAVAQEPDTKPRMKRLKDVSDEDLRKQLLLMPEVGLDQPSVARLYSLLTSRATPVRGTRSNPRGTSPASGAAPDVGPKFLTELKKSQAATLPWRSSVECQLGKEPGERLHVLSTTLRGYLRQSVPHGDIRPDQEVLRSLPFDGKLPHDTKSVSPRLRSGASLPKVKSSEWNKPEALPAIIQLLQAENTPVRLVMVDLIANIEGKSASIALAQRALFDASPEVRERAVSALASRPPAHFRQVLLDGFRYPWAPVAEQAAEAVVALGLSDVIPELETLLREPDPRLPFKVEDKEKASPSVKIRDLVRMNHLCNCVVCHAPSYSQDDLVRGRVPIPGENPPPLYYAERTGTFVRADITFIKQDFSVPQPVADSGKWPGNQRFDYLIRTRQLTASEEKLYQEQVREDKLPDSLEMREPLLFAMRELAGKDLGPKLETAPLSSLIKDVEDSDKRTGAQAELALRQRLGKLKTEEVAELLPILRHKDARVVRLGLEAVAAKKSEAAGAVDELTALLKHPDAGVRKASCNALQAVGPGAKAGLPKLLELVKEMPPAERPAVAVALLHVDPKDETVVETVVPILLATLHPKNQPQSGLTTEQIQALLNSVGQPAVDGVFKVFEKLDYRGQDNIKYRKTLFECLTALAPQCRSKANFAKVNSLRIKENNVGYADTKKAATAAYLAMDPN